MVKLGFTVWTKGSLSQVFDYFSHWENLQQWDLNVQSSKILQQNKEKIHSKYEVISIWKGKTSDIVYQMKDYKPNERIYLEAQNGTIRATDQLLFREKNGGTQITYNADITLRHVLWLLTPLVKNDFQELAARAEKGMRDKCKERYNE